jgi:hypothetical protein
LQHGLVRTPPFLATPGNLRRPRMLKSNMLKALTFYEKTEEKLQKKHLALHF